MDRLRWLLFRIDALFHRKRQEQDLAEELRFHLEEEAEEQMERGLPNEEARRAARRSLGSTALVQEEARNVWIWPRLEQVAKDVRFGWRQILKSKVVSGAAILSLALALGNCTAAFRLFDALFLRPLPVSHPEELYVVQRKSTGDSRKAGISESSSYPLFRLLQDATKGQAELFAISYINRTDLSYGSSDEMEKASRQMVSGAMFTSFGLRPALGRLLSEAEDRTPGGHPYAVISYDYWTRRFGQDPEVVGKTFRMGLDLYEIVGVVAKGFTGTEPGTMVDIFVPAMMNAGSIDNPYAWWFRAFVRIPKGVESTVIQDRMEGAFRSFQAEREKSLNGVPDSMRQRILNETLILEHAASGMSGMQRTYRVGLIALGVLVALVLLIACANVANLMAARASARARELALRVSIGAGRWRLVQLVAIECAWLAAIAAGLGTAFAWWAAPFVVSRINPPENPAQLDLSTDWRVAAFTLALAFLVTLLFGLSPAIRASAVKPASALKGGEDPHSRRRLMQTLIAVQVAFCLVVLFVSGLFVATYQRLAQQPVGFVADKVLVVDLVSAQPQPPSAWEEVSNGLRSLPGIESVAASNWALLSNQGWNNYTYLHNTDKNEKVLCDFLGVTPGWLETMKIPLIAGRDLLPNETQGQAAVVNQSFVDALFAGENPVGKTFIGSAGDKPVRIVGVAGNARYWDMRTAMGPAAYLPFFSTNDAGKTEKRGNGTLLIRTMTTDPTEVAGLIRSQVKATRSAFWVSNIRTQQEMVEMHTVRERLIAILALFFSFVALALAAIGLFGVLDYSVLQRRREIGIRMALGSPVRKVVRQVVGESMAMVLVGAVAGVGLGMASERFLESLLYEVKTSEALMVLLPAAILLSAAVLASIPPVLRAVRLDPVRTLRAE